MNDQWRSFLEDAGAIMDEEGVAHFGSPIRETKVALSGSVMADYSHYGLIAVRGKDAQTFLQGQLSNDITRVDASHGQLSGYCSPKGRLLAIFHIFARNDTYYLQLPHPLLESVMRRLQKYVLMSQVTLENASDTLVRLVCSGADSETALQALVDGLPGSSNEIREHDGLTIIRLPGNGIGPRYIIHGDEPAMEKVWAMLDARAAPVGAAAWERLEIRAGIPEVHLPTVEEFIPQTVNLELLGGVSFTKGCYTGQEIVTRLQHRGKTKRRMYRLTIASDTPPAPGAAIHLCKGGAAVGAVVRSAPTGDRSSDALASLMIEHHQAELCVPSLDGARARLESLPYDIPPLEA